MVLLLFSTNYGLTDSAETSVITYLGLGINP